jgi:hypothetical protein
MFSVSVILRTLLVAVFVAPIALFAQDANLLDCGPSLLTLFLALLVLLGIGLLARYIWQRRRIDEGSDHSTQPIMGLAGILLAVIPLVIGILMYQTSPNRIVTCTPNEEALALIATSTYFDTTTSEGCYVGYQDGRNGQLSYSDPFPTCAACEEFVQDLIGVSPNTVVVVPCFGVSRESGEQISITQPPNPDSPSYAATQPGSSQKPDPGSEDRDEVPPVIQVLGGDEATVYVGQSYFDMGAVALDDVDGDISGRISVSGLPVPTVAEGYATIRYSVRDNSGNETVASRRVSIIPQPEVSNPGVLPPGQTVAPGAKGATDRTAPRLILLGDPSVTVWRNNVFIDPGAQAIDDWDGNVTDRIVVNGLPVDTTTLGSRSVQYSVSDTAGNISTLSRSIKVVEGEIDTETDLSYVLSCVGRSPVAPCAVAELDGDGAITKSDAIFLLDEGVRYEQTGDVRVELDASTPVHSCFLKSDTKSPPTCAFETYPDTEITSAYLFGYLEGKLDASAASGYEYGIDLAQLDAALNQTPRDRIAYATVAQYDLNRDGVADFSSNGNTDQQFLDNCKITGSFGDCRRADINLDGIVDSWDLYFIDMLLGSLLPGSFTPYEFDHQVFQRENFTDAAVAYHCATKELFQEACSFSDFNEDGVVNQADWQDFVSNTYKLDVNKDGELDGEINLLNPYSL